MVGILGSVLGGLEVTLRAIADRVAVRGVRGVRGGLARAGIGAGESKTDLSGMR